ncbi:DUF975 family protein [Paenibacillus sp. GD4]|uniref:DUF975 family protein n=1 Tax=Paenibacillus sp. GD4 TaxID=3068890 RepID=UPI0027964E51|nr:DUF975 family protein [Paenibacillus sp. GD4]MDQ1914619.1 DUF975 family protein [Paenibacillus sp. GD4]
MVSNSEIKKNALESLRGNWGKAVLLVLVTFFSSLPTGIAERFTEEPGIILLLNLIGTVLSFVFSMVTIVFFLTLVKQGNAKVSDSFNEAFPRMGKFILVWLLMVVKILLWSLLLFIPGIIASFRYSQAFYIVSENPSISANECLQRSSEMMHGYKWKYFLLGLSFIGWFLLSIFTLFIGLLWVSAYMQAAFAQFYQELKNFTQCTESPNSNSIPLNS